MEIVDEESLTSTSKKRPVCELEAEEDPSSLDASSHKRRLTIDDEVIRKSNISDLACRALEVVLNHLMNPDIGWYTTVLEERLPSLKEEIVKSRVSLLPKRIPTSEKEAKKQQWQDRLLKNTYRMHGNDVMQFIRDISEIDIQTLMPTESVSLENESWRRNGVTDYNPSVTYFASKHLTERVKMLHSKYWLPVSLSFQNETISYVLEMRAVYHELQMAVITYFQQQRHVFQGKANVTLCQLVQYLTWKSRMEKVIERALFSYGLIPLLLEAERCHASAPFLCNMVLEFDSNRVGAISEEAFANWLVLLKDEFSSKLLITRFKSLEEVRESFKTILESLKSICYHILQFNTAMLKPTDAWSAQHGRSLIQQRAIDQLRRSMRQSVPNKVQALYDLREDINSWFGRYYPNSTPQIDVDASVKTLEGEARLLESLCFDLSVIHTIQRYISKNHLIGQYQGHYSRSYAILGKMYALYCGTLVILSPGQRALVKTSLTNDVDLEDLELPAESKKMLAVCQSFIRHSFESLAIRRLMADAVDSRKRGDRGCHYCAREKSCLLRREKTELVDATLSIVTAYLSKRFDFVHMGGNIAEYTENDQDTIVSQFSRAKQALALKDWQIMMSATETAQLARYDTSMFYSYPLLTFYKPLQDTDVTERRTQNEVRLKDGLALICSKFCKLHFPNDAHRSGDFVALAKMVGLEAIASFHKALTLATQSTESVPSTVNLELFAWMYMKLAEILVSHHLHDYWDSAEQQDKKLSICQRWWGECMKYSPWFDEDNVMTAHDDWLKTFARCSLLNIYIGFLTEVSFYEDGLLKPKDWDLDEEDPFQKINEVWILIRDQLTFIQQNVAPLKLASKEIQVQIKERLFWFEKTVEAVVMYFEATELLGFRLLRYGYSHQSIGSYFAPIFERLFKCCHFVDFESIVDSLDPAMATNSVVDNIEMLLLSAMEASDYQQCKESIQTELEGIATKVHLVLASEFETHAKAMTEYDSKNIDKNMANWLFGPSFLGLESL